MKSGGMRLDLDTQRQQKHDLATINCSVSERRSGWNWPSGFCISFPNDGRLVPNGIKLDLKFYKST